MCLQKVCLCLFLCVANIFCSGMRCALHLMLERDVKPLATSIGSSCKVVFFPLLQSVSVHSRSWEPGANTKRDRKTANLQSHALPLPGLRLVTPHVMTFPAMGTVFWKKMVKTSIGRCCRKSFERKRGVVGIMSSWKSSKLTRRALCFSRFVSRIRAKLRSTIVAIPPRI